MRILLLSACCLAALCSFANSTNELTVAQKVEILWTAHTNRIALVEAARARAAARKSPKPSAVDQVKENAAKRKRSGFGKASGGVK